MPRSQQAAIACADMRFIAWALAVTPSVEADEASSPTERADVATRYVRRMCGVSSRRELDADIQAASRWDALYARYLTETGQLPEPRG
jgi:hypothetical protein